MAAAPPRYPPIGGSMKERIHVSRRRLAFGTRGLLAILVLALFGLVFSCGGETSSDDANDVTDEGLRPSATVTVQASATPASVAAGQEVVVTLTLAAVERVAAAVAGGPARDAL